MATNDWIALGILAIFVWLGSLGSPLRRTRVSVLIGPDGTVLKTYESPDAEAHPAEALADLP